MTPKAECFVMGFFSEEKRISAGEKANPVTV